MHATGELPAGAALLLLVHAAARFACHFLRPTLRTPPLPAPPNRGLYLLHRGQQEAAPYQLPHLMTAGVLREMDEYESFAEVGSYGCACPAAVAGF